jgi:indole-3-glycerol phosphate synthase
MPEAQAKFVWRAPGGTLGELVASATHRAAELVRREAEWHERALRAPAAPSLASALRRGDVAVIAEVKRSSPSKGAINPGLDAAAQAQAYERGGAAAVSVLTEPERYGGSASDLERVAAAVRIPALKKDFHVAPVQLLEARALGAAAALLIARALAPDQLADLVAAGGSVGLELLVEIRDEDELDRALAAGAQIIGVNNRNLETLAIDPATSERIIPLVPGALPAIAESGVSGRADVARFAAAGADAVLVGSVLSASGDPVTAVAGLTGVPVARDERGCDARRDARRD